MNFHQRQAKEFVKEKNHSTMSEQSRNELSKSARPTLHFTDEETEAWKGYITYMKITNHPARGCLNLSPMLFSQLVSSVDNKSIKN